MDGLLVRLILATIFLASGGIKLFNREQWKADLLNYALPSGVTRAALLVVPVLEIAAAVLLITPWHTIASVLCLSMLIVFSGVLIRNIVRKKRVPCGCFGKFWTIEDFRLQLVRNSLLGLLAVTVMVW